MFSLEVNRAKGRILPAPVEKTIMVRDAGPGDLPAIIGIERVSFPTPWPGSLYAHEIIRPGGMFLAAEEAGVLVGYVCAWAGADQGHILKIAVVPELRRHGVGRLLMDALTERFKSRGIGKMWLEARERNQAARSFYRSLGFSEVSVHQRYYSDTGEDAIVMAKTICLV